MHRADGEGVEDGMKRGMLRKILLIAAGSVFLFSTFMVTKHRLEMRDSAEYTEKMVQMAVVPSPQPSVAEPQETLIHEPTERAPICVDFDALLAANQDVVAWLYSPDTPINYPVAQAEDNAYYLHRLPDGRRNSAGTLFMDYRNAGDLTDWNSVIYGHNMNNDSMFGTLTDYSSQAYFEAHPKLYLLTPEKDYVIRVVAGFTVPADAELYTAFNPDEAEKTRLTENWLAASNFVSDTIPTAEDHLITLSTCAYQFEDARYVLVGVLEELPKW